MSTGHLTWQKSIRRGTGLMLLACALSLPVVDRDSDRLYAQEKAEEASTLRALTLEDRNAGYAALEEVQARFEKYRAMHPAPVDPSGKEEADFRDVVTAYGAIIRKYPDSEVEASARIRLFYLHAHRGDMKEAEAAIEEASRRFAGTRYEKEAYQAVGIYYLQNRHDPAAAISWLEKIPLPEVHHPDTVKRAMTREGGKAWTETDERDWRQQARAKAMNAYEETRALHVGVLETLAKCDIELGRPDEAAKRYARLIELFPEDRETFERSLVEKVRRPLTNREMAHIHPDLQVWLAEHQQALEAARQARWGKEVNGLRCAVAIKPTEVRIGDPFVVTVEIMNVSDEAVTFFYQDLYQAMRLEITSAAGKVVKSQKLVEYDWPNPKTFYRRIEPGKTFTTEMKGSPKLQFVTTDGLAKNPAKRGVMIDWQDVGFLTEGPGKFTAELRLSADEKTVEQGKRLGFDHVWTGELVSNAVAFTVRPMTREELDGFIAQLRFDKPEEQRAAIDVLSANADQKAVPALMNILTAGTSPYLREAADALIRMQDTSVVPDLLALYRLRSKYGDGRTGELQSILLQAIQGLETDRRKLGDLFIDVLRSDASVEAHSTAAWNLAMGDHPQALEALIAAAKRHEPRMQYAAIDALTTLGHRRGAEKVVPPLIEILKTDPDSKVRGRAANAVGQFGDKSAVPALLEALKDPDYFVGSYAAHALGALADADAIPALEAYEKAAPRDSQKQAARGAIERIRQRPSPGRP